MTDRVKRVRQLRDSLFRDKKDEHRPAATLAEMATVMRAIEELVTTARTSERAAMADAAGSVAQLIAFSGGDPDDLPPADAE